MKATDLEKELKALKSSKKFDESIHYTNPTTDALSNFFDMSELRKAVQTLEGKKCTKQNVEAALLQRKLVKYVGHPASVEFLRFDVLSGIAVAKVISPDGTWHRVGLRWMDTMAALLLLQK